MFPRLWTWLHSLCLHLVTLRQERLRPSWFRHLREVEEERKAVDFHVIVYECWEFRTPARKLRRDVTFGDRLDFLQRRCSNHGHLIHEVEATEVEIWQLRRSGHWCRLLVASAFCGWYRWRGARNIGCLQNLVEVEGQLLVQSVNSRPSGLVPSCISSLPALFGFPRGAGPTV